MQTADRLMSFLRGYLIQTEEFEQTLASLKMVSCLSQMLPPMSDPLSSLRL